LRRRWPASPRSRPPCSNPVAPHTGSTLRPPGRTNCAIPDAHGSRGAARRPLIRERLAARDADPHCAHCTAVIARGKNPNARRAIADRARLKTAAACRRIRGDRLPRAKRPLATVGRGAEQSAHRARWAGVSAIHLPPTKSEESAAMIAERRSLPALLARPTFFGAARPPVSLWISSPLWSRLCSGLSLLAPQAFLGATRTTTRTRWPELPSARLAAALPAQLECGQFSSRSFLVSRISCDACAWDGASEAQDPAILR
jgi:hypothetical protein